MGLETSVGPTPVPLIEKSDRRSPASPERRETDTPNLRKLKIAVAQLHQAQILTPEEIAKAGKDPRWGGAFSLTVLNTTYPVNYEANSQKREDLVSQTYDLKSADLEIRPDKSLDQQTQHGIAEYKDFLVFQEALVARVPGMGGDVDKTEELLNKISGPYKMVAVHYILNLALELFTEDAIEISGLPFPKNSQQGEINGLTESLKSLARATADPSLRDEYSKLIDPLQFEESAIRNKKPSPQAQYSASQAQYSAYRYSHSHGSWWQSSEQGENLANALGDFRRNFEWEKWSDLEPTPDQTRKIYDIVQKSLFDTLYSGGRDSMEGQSAANILNILKDPRALPGLITYLSMVIPGYTSTPVVNAIWQIANNPTTPADLNTVLISVPEMQKRVLEEWVIKPSEIMKQVIEAERVAAAGWSMAHIIHNPEKHLVFGKLVELAEFVRSSKGLPPIELSILRSYFSGNFSDYSNTDKVDDILTENTKQVGPLIVEAKMWDLRETNQKLFNALVNPSSRDYLSFPRLVAAQGLSGNAESLRKLEALYGTRDLRGGSLARATVAEGLMFLNSREDGHQIFESIMTATNVDNQNRVPRAEPGRIRELLRMMQTLDKFGAFEFTPKPTLAEMIVDLKGKVVSAVVEKMELSEAEMPALNERLGYFLESGIVDIVPTLLARYQQNTYTKAQDNLRDIGRHIILGDFREWRNNSETSQAQLEALPEDKRDAWINPLPEITLSINAQSGQEARQGAADAVKRIATEAKAHVLDVYKLEFTPDRVRHLNEIINEIVRKLKQPGDPAEKRELGIRKRSLDAEKDITEGILGLEALQSRDLDPIKLMDYIAKLRNSMSILGSLDQPAQDLAQVEHVLTTQEELKAVSQVRAYETDDPLVMLKIGVEPRETCQSWRGGSFNQGLPSNASDANKRAINVVNENDEVLARTVAKLTHRRMPDGNMKPAILLEPVYTVSEHPQFYRAIARMVLAKAKATGSMLILSNEMEVVSGTDNSKMIPILKQEAEIAGFTVRMEDTEVFIPQSANQFEYSDTLGGLISWFERYEVKPNMFIAQSAAQLKQVQN